MARTKATEAAKEAFIRKLAVWLQTNHPSDVLMPNHPVDWPVRWYSVLHWDIGARA